MWAEEQCGSSLPVDEHFGEEGHSIMDCVFTPVEKIQSKNVVVILPADSIFV